MVRLEREVSRNLVFIAAFTAALSLVMEAVFLIGGWWNLKVLAGNIAGAVAAVLNFYLLCVTVQKAVEMNKEDASKKMRMSKSLRMLMIAVICALAIWLLGSGVPVTLATLIPLTFPRIALIFYSIRQKKDAKVPVSDPEGGRETLE